MSKAIKGIAAGLIAPFLFSVFSAHALAQEQELLPEQEAFKFSAQAVAADRIELKWVIAKNYYMYKDKFGVKLKQGDATLGELEIPPGKIKEDPAFGKVETYVKEVTLGLPVKRSASGPLTLAIEAKGQGCNEPIGVCYPPQTRTASLQLAAADSATTTDVAAQAGTQTPADVAKATDAAPGEGKAKGVTSLKSLSQLLGQSAGGEQEFLDPDQAFKMDLQVMNGNKLRAQFQVADGYYLYQDKIKFKSLSQGARVGDVTLPPGKEKQDEYFGKIVAYYGNFEIDVPLLRTETQQLPGKFEVKYQGCAEKGICYQPITKTVDLSLPGVSDAVADKPPAQGDGGVEADANKSNVTGTSFWWPLLLAFIAGIGLTFTPCVLPMVPILASIIVGQGEGLSRARGGALAIAYVVGTAITYTAVGIVAGYTGDQLQAYFQNAWALGTVAVILLVLSLSMFGLYEIQMPSSMQSKLQNTAQGMKGGAFVPVVVMGIISAAIVGACVSPVLMAVLGLAIERGDPVLGGAIMFSMAWGMGVLLIAMGFGAGFLLPRAGVWMDKVKYAFGVLLIAVAIYLLGIIPEVPVLYLWAVLFIVTAVYLGAVQSLPEQASGWRYLWKGVGVVLLVWGVLALLGGMSGNRDIMQPVNINSGLIAATGAAPGQSTAQKATHMFTRVKDLNALDQALAQAKQAGRPVLLDYFADWCVDCLRMEKSTFADVKVQNALSDFVLLQVDVTDASDEDSRAVKKRFGVFGPPAMLFFDRLGKEQRELRRYGYMDSAQFLSHISPLTDNARVASQ